METASKVAIITAVIGLTGTLGAAFIANGDKWFHQTPPETKAVVKGPEVQDPPPKREGPHAPPIKLGSDYTMWGENTLLLNLGPGESKKLDAMKLYANYPTYPPAPCAGGGGVYYSWQVREPYPGGAELEIDAVLHGGGGKTEQVAIGDAGQGALGGCGVDIVKNNSLQPMKVEIRYLSAIDAYTMKQLQDHPIN